MHKAFGALAAIPLLVGALATPALADQPMVGVSVGGGLVGPPASANGTINTNVQWSSGVFFRGEPWGQFTEASIGILSRSQALGQNRDEVFETSGLGLSIGAKAAFLHVGLAGELSLLHQILLDPSTPGTLMFHNGAGFVIEPYVGATLPFLKSQFSELELELHWPVFKLLDDSVGPRVMLTLWLGTPPKGAAKGGDDDDDTDKPDTDKPDMDKDSSPSGEKPEGKPESSDGGAKVRIEVPNTKATPTPPAPKPGKPPAKPHP